ncbi:MAG: hypothetical protein NXH85_12175 [Pseudomonadaceae bacterium]|nr:hypothetical protein [Pseudomonadaceae bacterium]
MKAFFNKYLEQLFWGAVLLSWVPVITAFSIFPSFLSTDAQLTDPILLPEPIYFLHPAFNLLSVLFVVLIPASWVLRKRYTRRAEETLFMSRQDYRSLPLDFKRAIRPQPPKYWLAALPLLMAMVIPLFANGAPLNNATAILYTTYLASIAVSVYLYLRYAHLISVTFVAFCTVLLIDALLLYLSNSAQHAFDIALFDGHGSILGWLFDLYTSDLLKVTLFILTAALLRMGYMAWVDNREFIESKTWAERFEHLSATAKLWYPMFLIFAGLTLAYQFYYSSQIEPKLVSGIVGCPLEDEAISPAQAPPKPAACVLKATANFAELVKNLRRYQECQLKNEIEEPLEDVRAMPSCPLDLYAPANAEEPDEQPQLLSLEAAILQTNERKLALLNALMQDSVGRYSVAMTENVNEAPDKVYSELNSAMPKRLPGTETEYCGLNPVCWVENGVKSSANNAYVSAKNRQLRRIRQDLREIANDTTKSSEEKTALMQSAVADRLKQLETINHGAVAYSFEAFYWLSQLLFIYSFIILLKTFMIVLSRISFARKTTYSATFKKLGDSDAAGSINCLKHEFKLDTQDPRTYFFARRAVTVTGPPMDRVTPQRFKAIFTRLVNGCLSLNRVAPLETEDGATITINAPAELVLWNLNRGERVFFHFADFVGMSDGVKLERRVSLSISTLIFGQIIHYCAVGPGRLYLRTRGRPAVITPGDTTPGHNASKLVAWNVATQFDVDANLNITNTFLSESNVRPSNSEQDMVVFDLSVERGQNRAAGILQFAKSFLLPI